MHVKVRVHAHVCASVCVCVSMSEHHVCACGCRCAYACKCVLVNVSLCIRMCLRALACVRFERKCARVRVCVYVCACVRACACMHAFVCMHQVVHELLVDFTSVQIAHQVAFACSRGCKCNRVAELPHLAQALVTRCRLAGHQGLPRCTRPACTLHPH